MTNLYTTEEWKSLDELSRAQLLLVIEGLKTGTIISGNHTSFLDILEKTGLDYKLNTEPNSLNPVFLIARPEDLTEATHQTLVLPQHLHGDEFHKISGRVLGYPECCTEEYVKPRTPEQQAAANRNQQHLSYTFGQQLTDRIIAERSYPDILDYRPPSFTPCDIECPEATRALTSWKEAIEHLDPEAAKELVYFNRTGVPEGFAHHAYLQQEAIQRHLEYRIELLRKTIED